MHVVTQQAIHDDILPPRVRHTLSLWGLADETDPPTSIGERLNIRVSKLEFSAENALSGVLDYVRRHRGDLLVFATHGRDGLMRWMHGSVAESVALRTRTPSLFFPPDVRGFVNEASGEVVLKRVLLPVDHNPPAGPAFERIAGFLDLFAKSELELRLMHVGTDAPMIPSKQRTISMGPV